MSGQASDAGWGHRALRSWRRRRRSSLPHLLSPGPQPCLPPPRPGSPSQHSAGSVSTCPSQSRAVRVLQGALSRTSRQVLRGRAGLGFSLHLGMDFRRCVCPLTSWGSGSSPLVQSPPLLCGDSPWAAGPWCPPPALLLGGPPSPCVPGSLARPCAAVVFVRCAERPGAVSCPAGDCPIRSESGEGASQLRGPPVCRVCAAPRLSTSGFF